MQGSYKLLNGVEYHRLAPDTFEVPAHYHRASLRVGEWAKLLFEVQRGGEPAVERMWVRVVQVLPEYYVGVLDNDSSYCAALSSGGRIDFHADHVINILPPRPYFGNHALPSDA